MLQIIVLWSRVT